MSDNVPSQQLSDPIASDAVISVSVLLTKSEVFDVVRRACTFSLGRLRWILPVFAMIIFAAGWIDMQIRGSIPPFIATTFVGLYAATWPIVEPYMAARKASRSIGLNRIDKIDYIFEPLHYQVTTSLGSYREQYGSGSRIYCTEGHVVLILLQSVWYIPTRLLMPGQIGLILSRFKNAGVKVEVR